jgi:hypothetical protein
MGNHCNNASARSIDLFSSWTACAKSEPCNVSGFSSASLRYSLIAWTRSVRTIYRSLIAFRTPSFTILPSRSIVFLAGGGSSGPAESFSTFRISCRFPARRRDALDASNSSSTFWSSCGSMRTTVFNTTQWVKARNACPRPRVLRKDCKMQSLVSKSILGNPKFSHIGPAK